MAIEPVCSHTGGGQAKVAYFDVVLVVQEDVDWLEVPVDHPGRVDVVDAVHHLPEHPENPVPVVEPAVVYGRPQRLLVARSGQ